MICPTVAACRSRSVLLESWHEQERHQIFTYFCMQVGGVNLTGLLGILSWKEHLSSGSGSLFGQGCLIASYFDSPGPLVHAVEPFRMIACKEFIPSWSWLHGGW